MTKAGDEEKRFRRTEDAIKDRENRALKWAATALLALAVFFLMRLVNQLDKTADLAQAVAVQNQVNTTQNAYVVQQVADIVRRVDVLERRMRRDPDVKQNSLEPGFELVPPVEMLELLPPIDMFEIKPEKPISPSICRSVLYRTDCPLWMAYTSTL